MNRSVLAIVALSAFLALPRAGAGDEPVGRTNPYRLYLPGTEPENVEAVRILAFEDGRLVPLAGALVTGWSEEAGDADARAARLVAEGRSDAHGFVNLVWPEDGERPFHWLADAPGKAVRIFDPGRDVFLARGAPYPLRVLSPLGEPLRGALVEYFVYGCPHSPAARAGTTDAEGELVLDGLPVSDDPNPDPHNEWGELWVVAEGVEPGPYGVPPRRPDGASVVVLTNAGRSAGGVVVDGRGRPQAGIVVRGTHYPRGPVTITDEAGRFRLFGLSPSEGIAFHDPDDLLPGRPNVALEDFESDVPLRIALRHGRASAPGDGEEHDYAEVEVLQRSSPTLEPEGEAGVPVRLARLSDGLVITGETGSPGQGLFADLAPPGRYRVTAGGGLSSVVVGRQEVDLPRTEPVRFVLDEAPLLGLRGLDRTDPEWVGLRVPGHSRTATGRGTRFVHLPPDGPALIHVDRGGPVLVPVGPLDDGRRTATVPPRDPAVVHLRALNAETREMLAGAEVGWADPGDWEPEGEVDEAGRWTLPTYRRGTRGITVWSSGFQELTIRLTLGPEHGVLDLGDVEIQPLRSRTLCVLHADGDVARGLELEWGRRGERGNELPDDDGTFALELGPRPVPAVLGAEGLYPYPLLLGASGPSEVRLPGGRLTIRVRDEHGGLVDSVAHVDHVRAAGGNGEHALYAVPAGTHTILVGAKGHLGAVRTIELGEGASRTLDFALPAR